MSKNMDELREIGRRMMDAYHSRTCWICGSVVDYEEQQGSRVIARPCGHFLWEGKARGSLTEPESSERE